MNTRRYTKFLIGLGTSLILFSLFINPALATAGDTTRVSVASDGTQGNGDSGFPSISADGRYVAFWSNASSLVSGDTNGYGDVFVHDRQSGGTTRVSVASDGTQGNSESGYNFISVSADGRYVAFDSYASNLVSGDTNGQTDVFVHDRQSGGTTRVSVASDGTQGNSGSYHPSISADGRYVAFHSYASNLVSGDTNGSDIFVHDRQSGQTTRVSLASDGAQGNGRSYNPSVSADGHYVAFWSDASNLVGGDTNGYNDIFIHDRQSGQTERVSVASDGAQGNGGSGDYWWPLSISADGRYVAFYSFASNLVSGDTNGAKDVFVHDRQSGGTTRVSVASDGTQGNDYSEKPSISADGRYVAFYSFASNLVSGDTNGTPDVFVHDRQSGETTRVSVASNGAQGYGGNSYQSSISADGRYVAFHSHAGNLVSGDTNDAADVFVHDRGGTIVPPTGKTPIVFVHGWRGFPPQLIGCTDAKYNPTSPEEAKGYFQGAGDRLKTDGGYSDSEIFYAQLVSNPCYTPPLVDNVPNLMATIDDAKAITGQSKVILIAHSMGGLVARAYIEGPDYRGDVAALFTFGSPHLGVPVDVITFLLNGLTLGSACENYQPAVCDFSVLGMALFNQGRKKNDDVTYHAVSGDAPFFSRNAFGMTMDALIYGPDDGIVPSGNGTGLAGSLDRWTTDEVHGTVFGSRAYFIRDGGASTSYTQCIKKVLVDGQSNCGSVGAAAFAPQDVPAALAQHTPLEYGALLSGQTATRSLSLEGGPTLFASQWQTGTLAFSLVDPNGQTIDPAFAAANPGVVTYTEDTNAATYYFPNATAGAWQLVLQAVSVPAGGAAFSAFAAFDSNVALAGGADKLWYTPGATATLTATLGGLPLSAAITAAILRADGITDTLPLSHVVGGQYQASYTVPNAPGYVEVRLVSSGTTASSLPFERGAGLAFQISPNTFTLTNNYSDSLTYPDLTITVGLNAVVSGTVGLSADLVDGSGNFVAHALTIQDVAAGTTTLTLQFNGADIFASQHNGPYTLTNVLLTDESGATLVTQQAQAVYTTAPYLYTDFAPNRIYLPLVIR